jgi:hypothetical protein
MSLLFHAAEHLVGELAAGHVADVQFDHRALVGAATGRAASGVRRGGHAVGPARAVRRMNSTYWPAWNCITSLAGNCSVIPMTSCDSRSSRPRAPASCGPGKRRHQSHLARLKHHIAVRHAAAGQHVAGGFLVSRQGLGLMRSVHHGALDLLALAGTTGAVLAAVGQAYPGTDARGEDGFFGFGGETASAGPHGDGEGH